MKKLRGVVVVVTFVAAMTVGGFGASAAPNENGCGAILTKTNQEAAVNAGCADPSRFVNPPVDDSDGDPDGDTDLPCRTCGRIT